MNASDEPVNTRYRNEKEKKNKKTGVYRFILLVSRPVDEFVTAVHTHTTGGVKQLSIL